MVQITKDTLRKLNAAVGKLDSDSGQVFLGFVGRLDMSDRLYHGELGFADVGEDAPSDTVSIQAILHANSQTSSAKPLKSPKSAKPARSDKADELTDTEK